MLWLSVFVDVEVVMERLRILEIFFLIQIASSGCSSEFSEVRAERDRSVQGSAEFPTTGLYDNSTESPLIDLIDAAQESIQIEIYEMREPAVHAALTRAVQERSVQVKIVIEPRAVGGCALDDLFADQTDEFLPADLAEVVQLDSASELAPSECDGYISALATLQEAGVSIRPFLKSLCGGDNKRCVQHGKMVLADRKIALISTGNFNSSSLCSVTDESSRCNRDYSVIVDERSTVAVLGKIFAADFAGKAANIEQILNDHPGNRLTISPFAHADVLRLVRSAKKSLSLQAQYLKEPELNEALTEVSLRGVKVEATLASACSFARIDANTAEKLRAIFRPMLEAGMDIRMFTTRNRIGGKPAYLHSKSFVVDNKRAWVGSINGSTQSFVQNREFGVISDDPDFVSKLIGIMAQDHASPKNHSVEDNLECESAMAEEFTADEFHPN
jgi:phosphatidylserine/phosphatidylglycerophosphate/cardiolipin synthase-like enzyme